jgi:hypothetical protein
MPDKRIPKKGDRVTIVGQEGVFAVHSVDGNLRSADLQQLGSDLRLASIPWDSITFLDAEKRIVIWLASLIRRWTRFR